MASWREEYIEALKERDEREKAIYQRIDDQLIDACECFLLKSLVVVANVLKSPSFWTGQLHSKQRRQPILPRQTSRQKILHNPQTLAMGLFG
jgi:hypothetical protein